MLNVSQNFYSDDSQTIWDQLLIFVIFILELYSFLHYQDGANEDHSDEEEEEEEEEHKEEVEVTHKWT